MPKYWVKNYFAHGSFPEVGQKQKTEQKKKKKRERLNDGNNDDQATHGARKPGPISTSTDDIIIEQINKSDKNDRHIFIYLYD